MLTTARAVGYTKNSGSAILDFGPFPGKNYAFLDITGQSGINNDTVPEVVLKITSETEAFIASSVTIGVSAPTAGVGFRITAYSKENLNGTVAVLWSW